MSAGVERTFGHTPKAVEAEAKALAAAMPGWTAHTNGSYWCFTLRNEQGQGLHINLGDAPKRYKASISWPQDRNHTEFAPTNRPSIGCDFQRGPEAFAKEIGRRLLPHLERLWPEQMARIANAESEEDAQKAAVAELKQLTGCETSQQYPTRIRGKTGTAWSLIDVNHNGSAAKVELNYSLPIGLVKNLLCWLEEHYVEEED